MDDEKSLDELWEQGTSETEQADVATSDELPADDSDLLGDEPVQEETEGESAGEDVPASELDKYYPQFLERFQKEVVPQIQSQAVEEAMRRMKESARQRDENIKAQLAPLVDYLKNQEEQGLHTREDSQRAYAAAYQQQVNQTEQRERAEIEAETRQRWLATQQAQQAPAPQYPSWVTSTEARMNRILEQSGLSESDPEYKTIPLDITHSDPVEALESFRGSVESAVKARQQRLQASAKPKPLLDMGTGAGAGAGNPLAGIEDLDQLWEMGMKAS